MSSIDNTDLFHSYIESVRKQKVKLYFKKNFFYVLYISILNPHSLHKAVAGNIIAVSDFHLTLIREILEKYCNGRRKSGGGRKNNEDLSLRLVLIHFPSTTEFQTSKKESPGRKCAACSRNERRETRC